MEITEPQYTRHEIDFDTWYSSWSKQLAENYTLDELMDKFYGARAEGRRASASHLRAIERTHSMTSNSQRRAQSRNVVAASGDYALALKGAIEIHKLFPEKAKFND